MEILISISSAEFSWQSASGLMWVALVLYLIFNRKHAGHNFKRLLAVPDMGDGKEKKCSGQIGHDKESHNKAFLISRTWCKIFHVFLHVSEAEMERIENGNQRQDFCSQPLTVCFSTFQFYILWLDKLTVFAAVWVYFICLYSCLFFLAVK